MLTAGEQLVATKGSLSWTENLEMKHSSLCWAATGTRMKWGELSPSLPAGLFQQRNVHTTIQSKNETRPPQPGAGSRTKTLLIVLSGETHTQFRGVENGFCFRWWQFNVVHTTSGTGANNFPQEEMFFFLHSTSDIPKMRNGRARRVTRTKIIEKRITWDSRDVLMAFSYVDKHARLL